MRPLTWFAVLGVRTIGSCPAVPPQAAFPFLTHPVGEGLGVIELVVDAVRDDVELAVQLAVMLAVEVHVGVSDTLAVAPSVSVALEEGVVVQLGVFVRITLL